MYTVNHTKRDILVIVQNKMSQFLWFSV